MTGFTPFLQQLLALRLSTLLDSGHPPSSTFPVFSPTWFFQNFFGRLHFLLPLKSRSNATLKTPLSSLLSTCPYHLTPFADANRCIVSVNPSMLFSHFSDNNFLTTHGFHHSPMSLFSLKLLFHFLLNTMPHFYIALLILRNSDDLNLSSFHPQRKPISKQ